MKIKKEKFSKINLSSHRVRTKDHKRNNSLSKTIIRIPGLARSKSLNPHKKKHKDSGEEIIKVKPRIKSGIKTINKCSNTDTYFRLILTRKTEIVNHEFICPFDEKYKKYFIDNLRMSTISNNLLYKEEYPLNYLIIPRLFNYDKGYLLTYFHIGIDVDDFCILASLSKCLNTLKGKGKINVLSKKQFTEHFIISHATSLTKEDLIYMLVDIVKLQIIKEVKLVQDVPDIIDYFRLKTFDSKLASLLWMNE